MNTKFSCHIAPDYFLGAPPLRLAIRLDDQTIFDQPITEPVDVVHEFPEDEADHTLTFEMSGKTLDHCHWDRATEQITNDCLLNITDVAFDDINIDLLMIDHTTYYHNFNEENNTDFNVEDEYHSIMGCNGRAVFRFQQPFYLWLLEHM